MEVHLRIRMNDDDFDYDLDPYSMYAPSIRKKIDDINDEIFNTGTAHIEGVDEVPDYIFQDREDIRRIVLSPDVVRIGTGAFKNCINITEIVFSDNLATIEHEAFYNCYNLTSIYIPQGVKSIGSASFYGCLSLENIEVSADNQLYSSSDGILYNKQKTVIIYYPNKRKGSIFEIPESVE